MAPGLATTTAASVESTDPSTATVAEVNEVSTELKVSNPFIEVCQVGEIKCKLLALIDIGSPVSFIKLKVMSDYIKPGQEIVKSVQTNLRNLNNQPLNIVRKTKIKITLSKLSKEKYDVELFILKNNTFEGDLILDRNFLSKEKLTLVYISVIQGDRERVDLFASLSLCVEEKSDDTDVEQIINNNAIDLSTEIWQKLKTILTLDSKVTPEVVDDSYSVQVNLKVRQFTRTLLDVMHSLNDLN